MFDYLTLVGCLEDRSQAFVIKRVGWLAAWNSCRPEGYMELALDLREERQVAKVNVWLSISLACLFRCQCCTSYVSSIDLECWFIDFPGAILLGTPTSNPDRSHVIQAVLDNCRHVSCTSVCMMMLSSALLRLADEKTCTIMRHSPVPACVQHVHGLSLPWSLPGRWPDGIPAKQKCFL